MSPKIDIDPEHAEAVAAKATLADKIRYACAQVDPPTTHAVQQWLAAYGVNGVTRAYATGIINTWRGEHKIGDTGDLVAMSPELLAELDALRSTEHDGTPADESPTVVGLTPVAPAADSPATAEENAAATGAVPTDTAPAETVPAPPAEPASAAEALPAPRTPNPDSDTVDTDRDSAAATITLPADSSTAPEQAPAVEQDTATQQSTAEQSAAQLDTAHTDTAQQATEQPATEHPTVEAVDADDERATPGTAVAEAPKVGNAVVVAEQVEPVDAYVTARAERVPNPLLEPAAPLTSQMPTVLSWSANMAWIVVLVAAMGISWWSLFEYARAFSIPTPLAAVVSLVFDASALIVAGLAHRYALSPYSGAGPRFALLALLAGSVYLNWEHAAGKGYGIEASIMFAAPAAVGILLFELHIGWHSRSERRARGRVARSLPVIGAWGWFLHPLQSVTTLWRVTHARGVSVREAELTSIEQLRAVSAN
ncbi:DUF2637 domain-containing protein [Actinokineospora terrae]|uniref:DUF2637 domain-containing protein n=1 Tax=Actinokineospora terrae TaxID=155974 RepID=A0A1H9XM10_9PSEU|nr:DUF2637 domain-containing protein [Actinokineospora terrae]SES47215.1 Protein of unknown function [Actinokineospora terrae]